MFGFLGPNGAGKTTTIRMIVGLAKPDRGSVRIRGIDLSRDFAKAMAHVGSIVESPDLYGYLTGRENLLHFARMLPPGARERIPELARLAALEERLDDKVETYSLGMRQRLGIAQALLGAPDLLVLDEPANGLDPAGIREIRRLVRLLAAERGIAVFVSSHLLSEVELMCDRVTIIHRGKALATGPVRELLDRSSSGWTRWRVRPVDRAIESAGAFLRGAADLGRRRHRPGADPAGARPRRGRSPGPSVHRDLLRRAERLLSRRSVPRSHGRGNSMKRLMIEGLKIEDCRSINQSTNHAIDNRIAHRSEG